MTIEDLKNEIEKENDEKIKDELQEVAYTIADKIENEEYEFDIYCNYDLSMLSKEDYIYSPLDIREIYNDYGLITKRTEKFLLSLHDDYYVLTVMQFPMKNTKKKYGKVLQSINIEKITKDEAKDIVRGL